jgi:hypothetical protein
MASTATAFFPGTSSFPNTTQYPGQGLMPIARCRISYDDVSVATPTWTEVANSKFRAFSSSRGRDVEHSEFDTGTASAAVDNRDRAFDPINNAAVRPYNRIWLYYEFSGRVGDIFRGYASTWAQGWPDGGWSDAVATANAADEFTVLSQAALPVTNPPRDTYADLIAVDGPVGYWDMNEDPTARQRLSTDLTPPGGDPVVVKKGLVEFRRHDLRHATRAGRRKR